jgi:hypothetical protein
MKYLCLFAVFTVCLQSLDAQTTSPLICRESHTVMLTHILTPTGPIPMAMDPNGVYPYPSFSETSRRPVPKTYRLISLENDYVKAEICPDLGGKILSMYHKASGKNVLYAPEIVKYTRILPRFYFIAGGIEVSFPISHSPTQNESLLYSIDKTADRLYVTCGERELRFGMQYAVEYSLGINDNFLTQRVVMYNPNKQAYPWMSWSNAALPSAADTRFDFPNGEVLVHSSVLDTISWEEKGSKTEKDITEMTGFFWKTKDVNAFGAYTPSYGSGLYHIANDDAPGIKLWTYGVGEDKEWAMLSSSNRQSYIEIQGGPISDQSIKLLLQPGEKRSHTEYWIPTDKQLNIYALPMPSIKLKPVENVPLFDWSQNEELNIWMQLKEAYNQRIKPPETINPAEIQIWAPSGMEDLDSPFKWAIEHSDGIEKEYWICYYGAWLMGRERVDDAISVLTGQKYGLSKILLARLMVFKEYFNEADSVYDSVTEQWLLKHPQIVVERDKLLQELGKNTLDKRERLLSTVDASQDEWILERKAQLLVEKEEFAKAKDLLLSIPFQKVHQVYERTTIWFQICKGLSIPAHPVPAQLGEDRLSRFGAYREFEK